MKKMLLLSVFVMLMTTLVGCETVKGIAQDIQNTGDNIWEGMTKKK